MPSEHASASSDTSAREGREKTGDTPARLRGAFALTPFSNDWKIRLKSFQ